MDNQKAENQKAKNQNAENQKAKNQNAENQNAENQNDYNWKWYHYHKYVRSDKYFVKGYFYELWNDNLVDPSTYNKLGRFQRKYYDIGIYYCPLTISENNNTKLRLINLSIDNNELIEINDKHIVYAKKLLCNDLTKALRKVDLRGADLRGAKLEGINLENIVLQGINLERAKLNEAKLAGAILREANLKFAKLRGADLSKVDFRGADLSGADVIGANLYYSKFLPDRKVHNLKYTSSTQLDGISFSGGVKNESRFFKLVSVNGKEVDGGRYELPAKTKSGKVQTKGPKDNASIAFSEICKKNNKKEECSYKFAIQETTQGSNKKVYNYEGKRKKLAKPIVSELKDKKTGKIKKVVKKYKNVVVAL